VIPVHSTLRPLAVCRTDTHAPLPLSLVCSGAVFFATYEVSKSALERRMPTEMAPVAHSASAVLAEIVSSQLKICDRWRSDDRFVVFLSRSLCTCPPTDPLSVPLSSLDDRRRADPF
jgi:hypothetical protein